MDVNTIVIETIQQQFGYTINEIPTNFNLYSTKLTIDELSDFIVSLEDSFGIDLDESSLPISNLKELVQYIESRLECPY